MVEKWAKRSGKTATSKPAIAIPTPPALRRAQASLPQGEHSSE
jgi:hypothetical protein